MKILCLENYCNRALLCWRLPLEETSEHCFLSIKVLFWCCGFIYCVVPLLFSAIFLFSAIIIDLVPYKWYESTFLGRKLWVIFFQGRDVFDILKLHRYVIQRINPRLGKHTRRNYKWYSSAHCWPPL
jgi:hypothetical protein